MIYPENIHVKSQDLSPSYHDAGQFYWMKISSFRKKSELFNDNTIPYFISELEAHDIDTLEDWNIAEFKYKCFMKSN